MFLGICLMLCSVLCFTAYSLLIQWFKLDPLDLVLGRGIVQVAAFTVMLIVKRESLQVNKQSLGFGLLSFWTSMGFILVLHFLPLSTGVILTRSSPAFAAIFAWILMSEPILIIDGVCIVTLFVGQLLVVQPSFIFAEVSTLSIKGMEEFLGVIIGLLCAAAFGLFFVLGSIYKPPVEHFGLIASLLCATIGLFGAALGHGSQIFHPDQDYLGTVSLKVSAISGVGAMVSIFVVASVGKCPPVLQSQILSLECPLSMVAQALILKEPVNIFSIIGLIFVFTSLITATLVDKFGKAQKESYSNINENSK